jgi:hypothetical protein
MWEEAVLINVTYFHGRTEDNHEQSHSGVQTFCVGLTTHYSLLTHLSIQGVAQEILIVQKTLGNFHFILRLEMHIQNFVTFLSRSDPVAQAPQCHI